MSGMHEGEIEISDESVCSLVDNQFPEWASRVVARLPPLGTDNQLFRLGEDLLIRMPRIDWAADDPKREHTWLPRLDEWVRTWTGRADSSEVDHSAVLAVWRDALDAPAWIGEPVWFHGDLHEGNLLVRDGQLSAVIDWGAVGRGDPAIELNAMWGYLPASVAQLYRTTVDLDEAAYRRARGFALAPAISGWTYYKDTAPHLSALGLATVKSLVASL